MTAIALICTLDTKAEEAGYMRERLREHGVDALLIDFGGFLGIGEKQVAVGMDNLKFMQDQNGNLFVWVPVTKDQLNAAPQYDENTYAQNRDQMRLVVNSQG